jgi:hypothetical protein
MKGQRLEKRQEREDAKSAEILFNEAMLKFDTNKLGESLARFEKSAAQGHEEGCWVWNIVKRAMKKRDVRAPLYTLSYSSEADTKAIQYLGTEFHKGVDIPQGSNGIKWFWMSIFTYYSGYYHSDLEIMFNNIRTSSEAGYSWGHVKYAYYFKFGVLVDKDAETYLKLLKLAASCTPFNPEAIMELGDYYHSKEGPYTSMKAKSCVYYLKSLKLGNMDAGKKLVEILFVAGDLNLAIYFSAKCESHRFWSILRNLSAQYDGYNYGNNLKPTFDRHLIYKIGEGLYWHKYDTAIWDSEYIEVQVFGEKCLGFYCDGVDIQQRAIFTFLRCWYITTGIKDVGKFIAQMVWANREENLILSFYDKSEH